MATLSHEAMRLTLERCSEKLYAKACDEYYTEMIQATSFIAGGKFEPFYVRTAPDVNRIVWQLTCGKSEPMAEAAGTISRIGGIGIDLNMGCSANEIVKQGAGIAWMLKDVNETASMVRGVRKAMPDDKRLSVKMRLGSDKFTEEGLFSFVDMLIGEGVTQIVIHPRTQKEKFRRTPHWQYAEKLASYVERKYGSSVTVIGNGDIKGVESLQRVMKEAPSLKGFMIGRAAVQKPWIFGEFKGLLSKSGQESSEGVEKTSLEREKITFDLKEIGLTFLEELKVSQPEEFYITRAQRFFMYFCSNFSFAHYLSTKIANAKSLEEIEKDFRSYFEQMPQEQFLSV